MVMIGRASVGEWRHLGPSSTIDPPQEAPRMGPQRYYKEITKLI